MIFIIGKASRLEPSGMRDWPQSRRKAARARLGYGLVWETSLVAEAGSDVTDYSQKNNL